MSIADIDTVDPRRPIPPIDQPARIAALVDGVRRRTDVVPEVGIVLGSGLGGLADDLEDAVAIPFAELPGWPEATAPGRPLPAPASIPEVRRLPAPARRKSQIPAGRARYAA